MTHPNDRYDFGEIERRVQQDLTPPNEPSFTTPDSSTESENSDFDRLNEAYEAESREACRAILERGHETAAFLLDRKRNGGRIEPTHWAEWGPKSGRKGKVALWIIRIDEDSISRGSNVTDQISATSSYYPNNPYFTMTVTAGSRGLTREGVPLILTGHYEVKADPDGSLPAEPERAAQRTFMAEEWDLSGARHITQDQAALWEIDTGWSAENLRRAAVGLPPTLYPLDEEL